MSKQSRFSEMLKLYMRLNGISTRQLARETGITVSTACRITQGKNVEVNTMLKLVPWLAAVA